MRRNHKLLKRRIIGVTICLCMIAAYTPVSAFADVEDDGQDKTPVKMEQTATEQTAMEQTANENYLEEEAITVAPKETDSNAFDIQTEQKGEVNEAADSIDQVDNSTSISQNDEATSGQEEEEPDNETVSALPKEDETLSMGEGESDFSYEEDGIISDDENVSISDEEEYTSDEEMPAIYYLIGVLFKGIKKVGLISSKYKITFDGITYLKYGNEDYYYSDTVTFSKKDAFSEHDKHGNVILYWIFNGHVVDENGYDIYTILNLDSARQSGTHIPGYILKNSRTQNGDFKLTLTWNDEEYNEDDLSQYLLFGGISVTENTYKKTEFAAVTVMDHSPATGDRQPVGLLRMILCLSLLSLLLLVFANRETNPNGLE